MLTSGPLRILIVRLSAVGDTVHGLPVLCALRDNLPNAHLSWLVEERAATVLKGHSALDRLIVAPRRWLRSPAAVLRLRRELRAVRPQIAIDLQGLAKSSIAARLSGATVRIGAASPDGREFSTWLNNRLVNLTASHVVDRYLELLAPLGISRPAVRFDVPRHAEDELSMGRFVRDRGLGGGFALPQSRRRLGLETLAGRALRGRRKAFGSPSPFAERCRLGRPARTCLGRSNHYHFRRIRAHGPDNDARRNGRTRPASPILRRLRYRTLAPCRGRGHSVRRTVWSGVGRAKRPLWCWPHCNSTDASRGIKPRAARGQRRSDAGDRDQRRLRRLRSIARPRRASTVDSSLELDPLGDERVGGVKVGRKKDHFRT